MKAFKLSKVTEVRLTVKKRGKENLRTADDNDDNTESITHYFCNKLMISYIPQVKRIDLRNYQYSDVHVAWISSDYFELLLLPQLLRGENDSKQSDEFQANVHVTFMQFYFLFL